MSSPRTRCDSRMCPRTGWVPGWSPTRNCVEFGEVMAATHLSGIIMATVNFRLSPGEMLDVLQRVSPSIVFCSDEFASVITELTPRLSVAPLLVSIGGSGRTGMVDFEEFVAGGDGGQLAFAARPDDIACLLFTTGPTGASKCSLL